MITLHRAVTIRLRDEAYCYHNYYHTTSLLEQKLFFLFASMLGALFVTNIDPNLGRVDINMLSDQTLMELLVEGFNEESKRNYHDQTGAFLDVCDWPNFFCKDDGRVTSFDSFEEIGGTIEFAYLPPKFEWFYSEWANLSGTLETILLPSCLNWFTIEQSNLHGTIDFTALPSKIESFHITANRLTGSAVFNKLPENLKTLHLCENQFRGTLCLTEFSVMHC